MIWRDSEDLTKITFKEISDRNHHTIPGSSFAYV